MYKLTLGSLTIGDASILEIVNATAAAGFVGCGLRVTGRKPNDGAQTLVGQPEMVRTIRRRLDETGIRLSNCTSYHFTPEVTLDDLAPILDMAPELRANTFGVACQDPDEARFVDKLAGYAEGAAKIGGRVAVELMPYSHAKTLEQTYRMILATGLDNVGLNLDALHLMRSGGTPADLKMLDPARIFIVQLCDAPRNKPENMDLATESRTCRLYPGEGALPLYEMLDAVAQDRDELECEVPHPNVSGLSALERAQRAKDATTAFLQRYLDSRQATSAA